MPATIIKRDGSRVQFSRDKIFRAIKLANEASGHDMSDQDISYVTYMVCDELDKEQNPIDVEHVQDVVEKELVKQEFFAVAKAYIIYRSEHTNMRKARSHLMDIYQKLTFANSESEDIKRENANINTDTTMGTMLKYGSEGSKYFIDNYILPKDIAEAHAKGDIHIHDKDFYVLCANCCQIDLIKLFKNGFCTGHGYLREPNSIESYAALCCIAIQSNQNEMFGGQSVPNFDWAMAQGVRKTYIKEYKNALVAYIVVKFDWTTPFAEHFVHKLVDDKFDHAPRIASMTTDSVILQKYLPVELKGHAITMHQYASNTAYQKAYRRTYQAMEALVHNLNTMHSRAGAQVPFSAINYGTDTSPEGRMAIECVLKATEAGLGNGETSIFPVQIFKVKDGVNYKEDDPNYDLFLLAIEVSAKRLFPNFLFLDAPFNLQYYRQGDYNSEVAAMGCRTRVMGNTDTEHEITCGRGNLSFTTINLPRLGIEAKGDLVRFFLMLEHQMELVTRQLLHRYKIQCNRKKFNYPFLMGNGIWLGSDNLRYDDTLEDVLRHGTLTIGFIGLAETLVALIGKHHGESPESQELGLKIIGRMREYTDRQTCETGLNFSLIATPAEGLSGRFVKIDREKYGALKGITDRPYYTNSFHIPVYFPITAHEKIELEAPYHALTNGGHITYVELDGDTAKNKEAFLRILQYMKEQGIGYGSINHPVDRDPVCGYTGIIDDICPRCGRRAGEPVSLEKLQELAKRYPHVTLLQQYL